MLGDLVGVVDAFTTIERIKSVGWETLIGAGFPNWH